MTEIAGKAQESADIDPRGGTTHWLWHYVASILVVVLLAAAVWLLHHELGAYHYDDVRRSVAAIPPGKIPLAILLTIVSYVILTAYDALALRYLRHALPYRRTALASFVGYAFAHCISLSGLGGAAPRYRLYSAWQLSAIEIATVVGFTVAMFWLGSLTVAGSALVAAPAVMGKALHLPADLARLLGIVCLACVGAYLVAAAWRRRPFVVHGWELSLPSLSMALSQVVVATVDWVVAAAVLYVLLPNVVTIPFWQFVGLFVIAQVAGVSSHVPGGIGVFDTIMLLTLRHGTARAAIFGALLVYRAVYYLLPLVLATGLLAVHEVLLRRVRPGMLRMLFGSWVPALAPRFLALTTFIAGTFLLLSGATPAHQHRMTILEALVPLPVMELSHFLGSLAGLGLMLLASGLQRRLDAAYHLAVALLATGAVLSLLKGFNYEEALALGVVLAVLLPCRSYFDRRASIISERFTPGWTLAIVLVVAGSIWLGFFVHKHQQYSRELWWQFSLFGDAPRFLRATVGVVAAGLFFAVAHLLRPARPRAVPPDADAMAVAHPIVAGCPHASAHLALLGDKAFLFSDDRRAFIMYAASGRSCVAMGDPVGPPECHSELVWRFLEMCDRTHTWPVFYEASAATLPLYLDVALSPLKFGEEARVLLSAFSLEGSARKAQRYIVRRIERDGGSFEVLPPEAVPALLPELARVSENWLLEKRTREKGFSLGCFDERYLREFPLAVVRARGTIVAFANLWCSGEQEEVALDLMRYSTAAPQSVMEYLFLSLILWAQARGYRWCNLGMAPLAGLESRTLAPLWHRVGAFTFLHGEPFYNFQGLRQFKQKFDPHWRPRYLVCPGGLVVPRVLANVAALVSGGLRGVITR